MQNKTTAAARQQPNSTHLEEAVLGAVMLDKDAIEKLIGVTEDTFYKPAHSLIFAAQYQLYQERQPIDLLTVMEKLKTQGKLEAVGGPAYLAELTNRVASAANIEYHSTILRQMQFKRDVIRIGTAAVAAGFDPSKDSLELVQDLEKDLFKLTGRFLSKAVRPTTAIVDEIDKDQLAVLASSEDLLGLPTGFSELDRMTSGLIEPDLVILAARPGMGKTAFIMSIATNLSIARNVPVGIFSMEMSDKQLISRVISMEAQVPGLIVMDPREGDADDHARMEKAKQRLRKSRLPIDDTPGLTITELRSKARKMVREDGCKLIIVDYIQLMSGSGSKTQNREQDVSEMSRGLKAMAKELQVPVIALSQLSRAVEIRGGTKRPQLSDLRESGSLEQDADQVWFLYRPWYYNIREDEEGNTTKTLAEVIVAKNRRGPLRTIKLDFVAEFTQFRNRMSADEWDEVVGIAGKQPFQDEDQPAIVSSPTEPDDDELPF